MDGRMTLSLCLLSVTTIGAMTGATFLAWHPDSITERLLESPGILTVLSQQNTSNRTVTDVVVSPLVEQAKRFSLYLDPPPPPLLQVASKPKLTATMTKPPQKVSLSDMPAMSPKFRVMAVSVYTARPEKSMVLIEEPGAEPRWVKCGERVGHHLVEEIQNGQILWRNGEQTGRVAVVMDPLEQAKENTTARLLTTGEAPEKILPAPLVEKQAVPVKPARSKPTPIKRGLRQRK